MRTELLFTWSVSYLAVTFSNEEISVFIDFIEPQRERGSDSFGDVVKKSRSHNETLETKDFY